MAWSDAARRAALEARRRKLRGSIYKPGGLQAGNGRPRVEVSRENMAREIRTMKKMYRGNARKAVRFASAYSFTSQRTPGMRAAVVAAVKRAREQARLFKVEVQGLNSSPHRDPKMRNAARVLAGGNRWQIENMNAVGNNPWYKG